MLDADKSVGRMASCASWAPLLLEAYVRVKAYSAPKVLEISFCAASNATSLRLVESVRM